jgi:DMATS type aromatic prenyltransferase
MVLSYMAQLPAHHKATLVIVSVDCIIPSKNRAKVYIRTQASSLHAIIDLMTLGGKLSNPSILSTIATLRHLWRLLFDGIDEDVPLASRAPDHYASGFLFYFEMSLGNPSPAPKVYIPVRFYCKNDGVIAEALAQYYKDVGMSSVGDRYLSDVQSLLYVSSLSVNC